MMTDPLSPLAQRIYGVLVVSAPVVHLSALEKAIGEQFGIGGPGWTALAELDSAGLIEILYDFRYRLTPLAWQALLAAERARAERSEGESSHYRAALEQVLECGTLLGAKIAAKKAIEEAILDRVVGAPREAISGLIGRKLHLGDGPIAEARALLGDEATTALVTVVIELLYREWETTATYKDNLSARINKRLAKELERERERRREAERDLSTVHRDHKRVLAQLEQTEQMSAAHFCEAEGAKKVIREMLEAFQRELRYVPHDQEQRWRKVAGLSEIKQ